MQLEFFILPGCFFSLAHLGIYMFHPMGETGLFAVTSQYLHKGSLQLKYRENSLLPLCMDVHLVGEAH